MARCVFDSSALLAFLNGEQGAETVGATLADGTVAMSAVNWSEVITKLIDQGVNEADRNSLRHSLDIEVHAFDTEAATRAAALRITTKSLGLSLGDRACLALATRHNLPILTADKAWSTLTLGINIHVVR